MLRRMVSDPAPADSSGGGRDGKPRGGALFAVPRLFVGFAAKRVAPDAEASSRSPTSPLDPKALLLRSPRSPRIMPWGAPGLVDALAGDAAANCLLSPRLRLVRQHSSPPKHCGGGPGSAGGAHSQPELGKTMSCPAPDTAAASATTGGMSVPCSRFQFHRPGDLKSGPEEPNSNATANCLLSPRLRLVRQHSSPPKDCGGGVTGGGHSKPELGKTMSCPAPDTTTGVTGGGMSVPCSRFQFHRPGDLKSGPDATTRSEPNSNTSAHLVIGSGSTRRSFDLSSELPGAGSLPAASRRFAGSVSASEIEQSEDYTRIIARGPNPKTTHIFGDCILEPRTVVGGGGGDEAAAVESEEGAAGCCYFVVKNAAENAAGADDFLSSCFACKKKLEGNDIYIYRGEKAFCSANCRDQEIQLEEEAENNNNTGSASPRSSCSSFHDDIFMSGMVVAT